MDDTPIRSFPLFAGLDEADLDRIGCSAVRRRLEEGELLFEEGDAASDAYGIVEGELTIFKRTGEGEVLLAVRGPGDVVGEMALIQDRPRSASAEARTDVILLQIPRAGFEELLEASPAAARRLFFSLLTRWKETEGRMRQREQLAQLGTLAAGLAHEINNPAAAVKRAAAQIPAAAERLAEAAAGLPPEAWLGPLVDQIVSAESHRLGTLERGDRRASLAERFTRLGTDEPDRAAAALVDAAPEVVDDALDQLEGIEGAGAAVVLAAARREMADLASVAVDGATRITDIVGAVKSYAFTGRGPTQDVDLIRMLDDTLVLMSHRLGDIEVVKDYGDVPPIPAHGSELNQVWANLIDNAVDAITEGDGGTLTLRIRRDGDAAVVEIEDDGPGIADDVLPRVFDSFFTTKPPGQGTGLGLDISYGIVVRDHGGEIDIDTRPGRTTVRVTLPLGPTA